MFLIFSLNYLFFKFIFSNTLKSKNYNSDNIHKLCCYINTYIFSLFVCFIILKIIFTGNYESYYNLLNIFKDYFLYDIVNMAIFSSFTRNLPYYIHHSLFLMSYVFFYDQLVIFNNHLVKILFCEITQIFLINCWILYKFTNNHKILKINGFLLLVTFFIFRIINFTYHSVLSFFILPDSIFYASYFMIILSLLNIYWFYLLTKMFSSIS